jgi:hypothetical protein
MEFCHRLGVGSFSFDHSIPNQSGAHPAWSLLGNVGIPAEEQLITQLHLLPMTMLNAMIHSWVN